LAFKKALSINIYLFDADFLAFLAFGSLAGRLKDPAPFLPAAAAATTFFQAACQGAQGQEGQEAKGQEAQEGQQG
jgi:hypothetical protein